MKRIISLLLVCTMLVGFMPVMASGEDNVDTENFTVSYNIADHIDELKMVAQKPNMTVLNYNSTNGFYKFHSGSHSTPLSGRFSYSEDCFVIADGRELSFEINVPESGTYSLEVFHGINDEGLDVDVYISRNAVSTDESAYVGYYSTYDEGIDYGKYYNSKITSAPSVIENVSIPEAGKYIITFVPNDRKDDGATNWIYGSVGSFNLVKGNGSGKAYMGARLSSEEAMLKLGNTKKIEPRGFLSDGTEITVNTSGFTSSNLSVATVSEDGIITPVAIGEAEISFTASYAGKNENLKLAIRVVASDGITIKYDLAEVITKLNMVTDRPNMTEITEEVTDGFFKFHSGTYDYFYSGRLTYSDKCIVAADGKRLSFEIFVPRAGVYNLEMFNAENDAALKVDVYLSRGEATLDNKIGQYDCYNADISNSKYYNTKIVETPNVIKDIDFPEAGKYIISFVPTDGDDSNGKNWVYGNVGSFNLVSGEGSAVMGIELADLNKTQVKVIGIMSDKTKVENPEGITVTYESSDDSIASVDANGKVTDHKTGMVTITATATTSDGFTYTDSGEYNALVQDKGINIYYDLVSAMKEASVTNSAAGSGTAPSLDALDRDVSGGFFNFHSATRKTHQSGQMMYCDTSIAIADGYHLAFEVFVPAPGIYRMEMECAVNTGGLDVDVYVNPEKASTDEVDKVGTYSTYDSQIEYSASYFTQVTKEPRVVENIKILEPGYYVFNFVANDGNPGSTTWIYANVGAFRLVSGGERVLVGLDNFENEEDIEIITIGTDNTVLEYTDPEIPATATLEAKVSKTDGTPVEYEVANKKFKTFDKEIVVVDEEGTVTAVGDGDCLTSMTADVDGKRYSAQVKFTAIDNTGVVGSQILAPESIYVREKTAVSLMATMESGNVITVPAEEVTFAVSPESLATIDKDGMLTGLSEGSGVITATASFRGAEMSAEKEISVTEHIGKTEPTYYTYEKRENAKKNIAKYSWAKSSERSAIASADAILENYEAWYDIIPGPGLPASMNITQINDDMWNVCHYCGVNLSEKYGNYSSVEWGVNPITRPWKIQCPNCKRQFPSNDFGLLYSRGVDEKGYFDRDRAVAANAEAVANGEKDALRNELYPEVADVKTINCNQGLRPGETVEGWGVDDSFGYLPKNESGANYYSGSVIERHCYIAAYEYMLWMKIEDAVASLRNAYLYTDDAKYGRAGAILLDRIADVYPDYDTRSYNYPTNNFFMGDAGTGFGKIRGKIADCAASEGLCLAADAFFPMLTDSQVISFLSEKAEAFGIAEKNDKKSSLKIWNNWEEGILKETFKAAKLGLANGNFGMHQASVAAAAVVLDREPETTEMVKWIYKSGMSTSGNVEGGGVLSTLVDIVNRDGLGNEAADNYNILWATLIQNAAQYLRAYDGEENYDLYSHPKYASMFTPFLAKTLVGIQSPNIGDSGATGITGWNGTLSSFTTAFEMLRETPFAKDLAQFIYMRNKYEVEGLNYGIFSEDPEAIQSEILALATDGPLTRSDMLAGYGIAVLRDGYDNKSVSSNTANNNQRDFWIYFGRAGGHGHSDTMNLGIDAFGFSFAPDMGYPAITGKDPVRLQWDSIGLSHNTVTVDGQSRLSDDNAAFPMHYDDSGMVKLIDVESDESFKQTDNYRRTLVMVNAGDDVSYGVDFFRITGGERHTYSFHAAAETATPVSGLDMVAQVDENGEYIGSYVGVNVPYTALDGTTQYFTGPGQDPWTRDLWSYETCFTRGYSWLSKVRRDNSPEAVFSLDFDVNDYRNVVTGEGDTHLRVTQLNDFVADEVAIVGGPLPVRSDNSMFPKTFDYMLVHHDAKNGEKLESLYTTVYEPYSNERYISDITPVEITGEVSEGETVRAVKVLHTSGRCDYVVYSTDNTKTYRVADLFDFRGFVGVYSVNTAGEVIYRYVNDGDIIGDATETVAAYNGKVIDFDKAFEFGDFENWIDVEIDCEDLSDIIGRYMYIETDGVQNGAYKIVGAEKVSGGKVRIDIGTISLVRSFIDPDNESLGYTYNIEEGQAFRIPMPFSDDKAPVFDSLGSNLTASAGSVLTLKLNAESPIKEGTPEIKYMGTTLPRGAAIDEETGVLTWKPERSQVGDNHIAITAADSDGRETTIHFTVKVYGSTTGGTGGGTSAPTTSDKIEEPETPDEPSTPEVDTPEAPEVTTRFIDLGSHAWAADAINTLAEEGIIKGTSENTFSPGNNITRADFAILLVRAFELSSDNEENFADVATSDYFAKELAVARNTGIVGGIGDNKYAPKNFITRQDMMVIVYRALKSMDKLAGADIIRPEYEDFDSVSDYAKEAVSALIGAGLVNGKNGKIAPLDNTTRAEVAVLLKRILDFTAEK